MSAQSMAWTSSRAEAARVLLKLPNLSDQVVRRADAPVALLSKARRRVIVVRPEGRDRNQRALAVLDAVAAGAALDLDAASSRVSARCTCRARRHSRGPTALPCFAACPRHAPEAGQRRGCLASRHAHRQHPGAVLARGDHAGGRAPRSRRWAYEAA